ncbi:MAG: hypothetical protein U0610_16190 [bacterium]
MSPVHAARSWAFTTIWLVAALSPAAARADWRQFVPTPRDNEVFLETFTSFERDHSTGIPTPILWTDTFLREKLRLDSEGYSYDPRFLQYRFSLGVLLRQEDYENSQFDDLDWRYGEGVEYNVRVALLPEHRYNLDLFATRVESLYQQQSAVQHDDVGTSYGGSVQYRDKPYFVHAGFVDNTVESSGATSEVRKVDTDAQYFKRFTDGNELSFSGAYNPAWFDGTGGLDGRSDEYLLGNFINLSDARLSSDLTWHTSEQSSDGSDHFSYDQFLWDERLVGYLPWNFRTEARFRYQDDESRSTSPDETVTQDYSSHGYDVRFDLIHRLFQSLDSRYTLIDDLRASPGGRSTNLSNGLTVNYTKAIPSGRLLLGGNAARSEVDSQGRGTDIVNEPHRGVSVPVDVFTLDQQNVDEPSIQVFFRSPLAPFEIVELTRSEQYAVRAVPNLNTFEIQVFALPPRFAVPGSYDFFVSYSLLVGDFALRIDTLGSTATLELFDNLVAPYAAYTTQRSDVLSGSFPGYAVDSSIYTAGVRVTVGPVRLRGEYQDLEWDVNPYDAWRAEIQYVDSFQRGISLFGSASYVRKHYREGSLVYELSAYSEDTVSVTGNIQKRFTDPAMAISTGASFQQVEGLIDTRAFALNAAWNWTIGKLDFALGASAYGSESMTGQPIPLRRDHELVYLRVTRQLY